MTALDHIERDMAEQIRDSTALQHLATIARYMPAPYLPDPDGVGTAVIKAQMMTQNEVREFSDAIDALAEWASVEFWSERAGR
jgi:hypothetical protein